MLKKSSKHLSCCSVPISVDYLPEYHLLSVSSKNIVAIYNKNEDGTPRQIIQNTVPNCIVDKVKFQKGDGFHIAVAAGANISVRDLGGALGRVVDNIVTSSSVTDLSWSSLQYSSLATTGPSGVVGLWDVRSCLKATGQLDLGLSANAVQWSPTNCNFLSVCCANQCILVCDLRMLPRSSLSGICKDDNFFQVILPERGVFGYGWDVQESSLIVGNGNNCLEMWNVGLAGEKLATVSKGKEIGVPLGAGSIVLPDPLGIGVVVTSRADSSGGAHSVIKYHPIQGRAKSLAGAQVQSFKSVGQQPQQPPPPPCGKDIGVVSSGIVGMAWARNVYYDLELLVLSDKCMLQMISIADNQAVVEKDKHAGGAAARGKDAAQTVLDWDLVASTHRKKYHALKQTLEERNTDRLPNSEELPLEQSKSGMRLRDITRPVIVGPRTFVFLMSDEIFSLESSIRSGHLDGLKLSQIDQFTRRIVLELLLPSPDVLGLANKANLNSYYKFDELQTFYKKGSTRTVELVMSFAIKCSTVWVPIFLVENKTGIELGDYNSVTAELTALAKFFFANNKMTKKSLDLGSTSSAPNAALEESLPSKDVNPNDGLLLLLGRAFRKSMIKLWEKKMGSDRLSFSFGSLKRNPSGEVTGSLSSEHKSIDGAALYHSHMEDTHLSYRVPFPVSSGGIFNAKGELVCFGAARLGLAPLPTADAKAVKHNFLEGKHLKSNRHVSYANIVLSTMLRKTLSNASLLSNMSINEEGDDEEASTHHRKPSLTVVTMDENTKTLRSPYASAKMVLLPEHPGAEGSPRASALAAVGHSPKASAELAAPPDAVAGKEDASECGSAPSAQEDEDDYQFSFDKDLKPVAAVAPLETEKMRSPSSVSSSAPAVVTAPSSSTKTPKPSDSPLPTAGGAVGVEAPLKSHNVSFPLVHNKSTSTSSFSYFIADIEADPKANDSHDEAPAAMTHRHSFANVTLSVYSVVYVRERQLLEKYALGSLRQGEQTAGLSRSEQCRYNAAVASKLSDEGSRGLQQYWCLLATAIDVLGLSDDQDNIITWGESAIGCDLVQRLLTYAQQLNDLLTLAISICVLGGTATVVELLRPCYAKTCAGDDLQAKLDICETRFNNALYSLGAILMQWEESLFATKVRKFMRGVAGSAGWESPTALGLSISVYCINCNNLIESRNKDGYDSNTANATAWSNNYLWCQDCSDWAQYCSICHSCVRGLFSVCPLCGHGGHGNHLEKWFLSNKECPTGCGCKCVLFNNYSGQPPSDELEEEEGGDVLYERDQILDIYGPEKSRLLYSNYDSHRPHYLEEVLSGNHLSHYNYNNFSLALLDGALESDLNDDDEYFTGRVFGDHDD